VLHQTGHHAEALELILRAVAIQGPHPVFHSNLAAVYLELGRLDDAIAHARAALGLQPDLVDAHLNLGAALLRHNQYEAAGAAFAAVLRLDPRHIEAWRNLALALQRLGRLTEAVASLEQTLPLALAHAGLHHDLGGLLLMQGEPDRALSHLREAVRLRPDFAPAYGDLGEALTRLGHVDDAVAAFRTALDLDPHSAATHNRLAYVLECRGQVDAARAELLAALELEPDNARTLAGLSVLALAGHHDLSPSDLDRMRTRLARPNLPADDASRLHFALARGLDKAGAYDEAFEHYRAGNELTRAELCRRGSAFDVEAHRRYVDRLIAAFGPVHFDRLHGAGVASPVPIFIVGMPRSGTTLVEQILASHPAIYGAGERQDIP
jgi:tetratricopeptide (TPR) repeat protein